MAIRDANKLASGDANKATAMARGEVEALLRRADDWMVVPVDKVPASAGDGGCMAEDALGAHHKAQCTKAGGCMAD